MKKVLLLALTLGFFGTVVAQKPVELPNDYRYLPAAPGEPARTLPTASSKMGGNVAGWFSPLDFLANNSNWNPNTDRFISMVFPDSTVVFVDNQNDVSYVGIHAYGHIFDLRHDLWSAVPSDPSAPILPFAQKDNYLVDSIAFRYLYRRNYPDTTVVDTCFVHYYKNIAGSSGPDGITTGNVVFGATDTVRVAMPTGLNQATLSGTSAFRVDTILLTIADTTSFSSTGWGSQYMVRYAGFNVPGMNANSTSNNPASLFGYSVSFRPGHPYNLNDTLESQGTVKQTNGINYFGGLYGRLPEPAPGTSGLPPQLQSKIYVENSIVLTKGSRYGQQGNGWDFIPGLAFFAPQFYDCQAYVTGVSTVSAREIADLGYSLGNSYPNPVANGQTMGIDYGLKTAGTVTLEVYDLMGKKVATIMNNENVEAGDHTALYNVSLQPGIYFYTMFAGDVLVASKKFNVVR